jgi:hypothetical protein
MYFKYAVLFILPSLSGSGGSTSSASVSMFYPCWTRFFNGLGMKEAYRGLPRKKNYRPGGTPN